MVKDPDGKVVGSLLIAQPFTKDEYFQPRPSACSYDASASASSALAASNYALRDRVATALGPIVTYKGGPKDGKPVAPDIEAWFQKDQYQGSPTSWRNGRTRTTAWPRPGSQPIRASGIRADWAKPMPRSWPSSSRTIRARLNRSRPTWRSCSLRTSRRRIPANSSRGHDQRSGRQTGHEHSTGQGRLGYSVELLRHVAAGPCGCRASGSPGDS